MRPRRLLAPFIIAIATACEDSDTAGDAGGSLDAQLRADAVSLAPDAQPANDAATSPDAQPSPDAAIVADGGVPLVPTPAIHTFSPAGHDRLLGAAFDQQNNLVAVGVTSNGTIAADLETIVVRIRPDGMLDPTFGTAGVLRRNLVVGGAAEVARGVVIQSDGKIVILASVEHLGGADPRDTDVALVRLTRTGTIDASFGNQGVAIHDLSEGAASGNAFVGDAPWGLALTTGDALILAASRKSPARADSDWVIAKLTARGALDPGFATGGIFELDIETVNANARQPLVLADGSIVGSGYKTVMGITTAVLFKLTAAGRLDPGFAANGVFDGSVLSTVTEIYAVQAQSNGGLVTAGYGRELASGTNDLLSLRFSPTGVLDRNYGNNGAAVIDFGGFGDNVRTLVVLPDDRAVLVGNGRISATNNEAMVTVLTSTGAPDRSFGPGGFRLYDLGGPADAFWSVARAPDGRLGIVGVRGALVPNGNDDAVVLLLPAP